MEKLRRTVPWRERSSRAGVGKVGAEAEGSILPSQEYSKDQNAARQEGIPLGHIALTLATL